MATETKATHTPGPRFTRNQVIERYQAEVGRGETKMPFDRWLMDEVNALESINACLLEACEAVMRCARGEIERPVTERQPWTQAQRLLEAAIAKAT